MTKTTPTPRGTSSSRQARNNILAFVQRTGKIVFSFDDVDVNSITMRKLVGNGVIAPYGMESTETSQRKKLTNFQSGKYTSFQNGDTPSGWDKIELSGKIVKMALLPGTIS